MTLGNKLAWLRQENGLTQEQLAEQLGVSQQTVSSWEADEAFPETQELIRVSKLLSCSMDELLKDDAAARQLSERASKMIIFGMPIWCVGRDAWGFLAIGMKARGVIAIGFLAQGIISLGFFSVGLLSLGLISLGLLALGSVAVGVMAAGAVAMGIFACGAVAIGEFSLGAVALGRYFARGDHARGMVALGKTRAAGSAFAQTGRLNAEEIEMARALLRDRVPEYLKLFKHLAQACIR